MLTIRFFFNPDLSKMIYDTIKLKYGNYCPINPIHLYWYHVLHFICYCKTSYDGKNWLAFNDLLKVSDLTVEDTKKELVKILDQLIDMDAYDFNDHIGFILDNDHYFILKLSCKERIIEIKLNLSFFV